MDFYCVIILFELFILYIKQIFIMKGIEIIWFTFAEIYMYKIIYLHKFILSIDCKLESISVLGLNSCSLVTSICLTCIHFLLVVLFLFYLLLFFLFCFLTAVCLDRQRWQANRIYTTLNNNKKKFILQHVTIHFICFLRNKAKRNTILKIAILNVNADLHKSCTKYLCIQENPSLKDGDKSDC